MDNRPEQIAALDLGTNTFNLVISRTDRPFPPVFRDETGVFIGKGGLKNKIILPDAFKRAQETLHRYSAILKKYRVSRINASATEAIRNAENGNLILKELDTDIPFSIDKISGKREAALTWMGVEASGVLSSETAAIIDIGGASTEIIIANRHEIKWLKSYKVGVSRALESHPVSDLPTANELGDLQDFFVAKMPDIKSQLEKYRPGVLIGTAGSFDTWRKILEPKANEQEAHYLFNAGKLKLIIEKINHTPFSGRTAIKGIPEIRRETIVPAGMLVLYLLDIYTFTAVYQCSYALAEGMINEMIKKQF